MSTRVEEIERFLKKTVSVFNGGKNAGPRSDLTVADATWYIWKKVSKDADLLVVALEAVVVSFFKKGYPPQPDRTTKVFITSLFDKVKETLGGLYTLHILRMFYHYDAVRFALVFVGASAQKELEDVGIIDKHFDKKKKADLFAKLLVKKI